MNNSELVDFFKTLEQTSSLKAKEAALKSHINDLELKTVLEATLNPYKLYQFNKMPYYIQARPMFKESTLEDFLNLLGKLERREITGHSALQAVLNVFSRFYRAEASLFEKVLLKGSIGVGTATVNKVWPNLIPEFKLMLAPNAIPNITQVKFPCEIQYKADGARAVFIEGQFWSRSGRPFPNNNLKTYFSDLDNIGNYVLDGELYDHTLKFNDIQSIISDENKVLPKTFKYVVYDCIPLKDWKAQNCKIVYQDRLTKLREIVNSKVGNYKKVTDIASDTVESAAETIEIYKKHLKNGYEGSMLKDRLGLYQWKRVTLKSGEMLKLKPFETLDLKITGVYPGEGKFVGLAGGVTVDFKGTEVSVGSGFTLELRKQLILKPSDFIGKTIEIKYFEETEDGSLRFPTFKRFRPEKD